MVADVDQRWGQQASEVSFRYDRRNMVAAPGHAHEEEEELPLALSLEFDPATSIINFTLYEHTAFSEEPVPLQLKYEYRPDCGYAPSQSAKPTSHSLN
jgi:hypothetical protein